MVLLPGFRDFYPQECLCRSYILSRWRDVCRRLGFVEYDGPVLESIELFKKKSGNEIVGQLFNFTDKGEREVAMRPEMTPTLARMVIARERDYKKPLKWFSTAQFFRYEKQQRGRTREFIQLNCDIIGEASSSADAELVALVVALLRSFGFSSKDFVVRVNDRNTWLDFFAAQGGAVEQSGEFLGVIDKMERQSEKVTTAKLLQLGISYEKVREFIQNPVSTSWDNLRREMEMRGLEDYVELDPLIVRGLAYYTGFVFEVFDRQKKERALAGGGRYDQLLSIMSDGKVDLPALGFGMGDVVLGNFIQDTPAAKALMDQWCARENAVDLFVIIADEEQRPNALKLVQKLRDDGYRLDFPLSPAKVGKQFQQAEHLGARVVILLGSEWPLIKVKTLETREEFSLSEHELPDHLSRLLKS